MTSRLPRAASSASAASLPPDGLDGLNASYSRVVTAPESSAGVHRGWHVLDNLAELDARGIRSSGTILCVHGNPTWSYLWRRLVAAGADAGWRVIAVDQLEMGFSERTGSTRTLASRVRDLGDLTDALALDGPVVTLGHDWGGVVSLGWAVDHPHLLAGVMLLNTAIHQSPDRPIPAPLRLALSLLGPSTVTTPAFLETTLAIAHPPLSASVKDAYRAPYRGAARRGGIGGFVADIPATAGHESRPELDRIASGIRFLDVPALMLWGPRDPIFGDRYLDDLMERMPQADVHRFEGAGHLVAEDRDYVTPVLDWLGDRFGAGSPLVRPAQLFPFATTVAGAPATVVANGNSHPPSEAGRAEGERARTPSEAGVPAAAVRAAGGPAAAIRPLWRFLDELRDSDDAAIIEMNPAGGRRPRTVSWRLLSRRVRELAAGLSDFGVRPGDRVSLLVPPGADLTLALYACLRIGAVVVIADAGLGLRGLTRAVRGARADYVIGAPPGLAAARALGWPGTRISVARLPAAAASALRVSTSLPELVRCVRSPRVRRFRKSTSDPTYASGNRILSGEGAAGRQPEPPGEADVAAVLFTSGSTGPAKGVVYTHGQLGALCAALADQYGIGVGTGLVAGFAPFALLGPAIGARSVTPDMDVTAPRTLTARAVAAAVAAADGTVVFLSPAAIANVVATASDLDAADRHALAGVRTFLSAGAPIAPSLLAAAAELMPDAEPHTPYGMTEGLLMTDIALAGIRDAISSTANAGVVVGSPAPGVRVRISPLDELGRATGDPTEAVDVTGEILVSAAHVEDHYDKLWITDRESRRGAPDDARWHRTGDVGHLDAQGRLWVEGRMPHVISSPNGPVTPVGPELAAATVDGVARAAVVGVGPLGAQQVVAVVEVPGTRVRKGPLAEPALAASVRSAVADAALSASVPSSAVAVPLAAVLVVPALPTDIRHNSKIDRARVARWASDVLAGGRPTRLSTRRP